MKERIAVRLLLLSPQGRLLLLRGEGGPVTAMSGEHSGAFWFTAGGGLEPGEDLMTAARREVVEETGHTRVRFGPAVWCSEQVLSFHGEPTLFKETYVVAHADSETLDPAGWTELEREMIRDWRWWSLKEITATAEVIFPWGLADLLPDVLAGRYPATPLTIART